MTVAPYTFGVGLVKGSYTFRARAYDNLGVYTDTLAIPVIVNTPPVVSLTAPLNNAVITAPATFNLNATATDADNNISKVEFYQAAALLGTDTSSPYSWPLSNIAKGSYIYTAKVYDVLGGIVTSSAINVLVNAPPTISLTTPNVFGTYNAPVDLILNASPADSDGTITKVDFYSGATLIATRTVPPYSHTVVGAPAAVYAFTAKVHDNKGAVTTSNVLNITVAAPLSPAKFTYDELGRLIGVEH